MTDEELLAMQNAPPFALGAGYSSPPPMYVPPFDNTGRIVDPTLLAQQAMLGQQAMSGQQSMPDQMAMPSQQSAPMQQRPSYAPLMTPENYLDFYLKNAPEASKYVGLEVPKFERYVPPPPPAPSSALNTMAAAFGGGGGGGYDSGFGGGGGGYNAGDGGYGSGTVGYDAGDMGHGDASAPSSKIVCTAMNQSYGFGSFRNKIWLAYAAKNLTKAHEVGYHAIFLPLVDMAYKQDVKPLRAALENIARHRSADLRAEMRGTKRDTLGRVYRFVLEPLCYAVGKVKGY